MPTVLIVPGLRDAVEQHWQTLLAADLAARGRRVRTVPPMGRTDRSSSARSSFACMPGGISPTSSRKSVPPLASVKRPRLLVFASVNAPLT